jgi:hypothetical protein
MGPGMKCTAGDYPEAWYDLPGALLEVAGGPVKTGDPRDPFALAYYQVCMNRYV